MFPKEERKVISDVLSSCNGDADKAAAKLAGCTDEGNGIWVNSKKLVISRKFNELVFNCVNNAFLNPFYSILTL